MIFEHQLESSQPKSDRQSSQKIFQTSWGKAS